MRKTDIITIQTPTIITDFRQLDDSVVQKVGENIVDHFAEKANHVKRIVVRYTTIEDILDDYDGLMFFDTELQPLSEAIGQISEEKIDALYQFQKEMHFISKLLTVQKYYSQRSDFYKNEFIKRYTNPSIERDELDITKRGSMTYMELEEFMLFKAAFDELFNLE